MQTGRTRYIENVNFVVFSGINCELTTIKQKLYTDRGLLRKIHVLNV